LGRPSSGASDEYDLQRFVRVQSNSYDRAITALRKGRIGARHRDLLFPRLGHSGHAASSRPQPISCLDEARAYLAMPLLGGRYRECIGVLQRQSNMDPRAVFGMEGATLLHASLTLFSVANSDEFLLETIFDVWFDGLLHEATMRQLRP
jgi:uncharacterized protein (DUF1810 family)